MATRWLFAIACSAITYLPIQAQSRETYDLITYSAPAGWTKESADYAISFMKVDQGAGAWCRMTLYKSMASTSDPETSFKGEWQAIVAKSFPDAIQPAPDLTTEQGWTSASGVSKFQWQSKDAMLLLTTVTGYGVEMTILVTMNDQMFMPAIESFLNSLDFAKPEVTASKESPQVSVLTEISDDHGISISTTNFDDGWVAQPFSDYVKLTKGGTAVLLHYPIKITDEMRDSESVERWLWNSIVEPRYQISNMRKFDNGGPCYFCIYFFEADAIDRQTAKKSHLGFRVLLENGVARCIEIIASTSAEFSQHFPDQEKIAAMLGYNKFAVTKKDIEGTWEESSGAAVNMYNTVTGSYAGMNTSSSSNSFVFHADDSYESHHSGAYGMVGAMQFYDQKYKGKSTVTNWDLTLTNRFEGKTDIYWVQFEAVKGGRVLHLTDKTSSGMQYHLVKTK